MFLPNKAAIETEIIDRYLNNEINVLEKEVALNIILSFTTPDTDLTPYEIFLFQELASISFKTLVDYMVDYGRSEFNSDKLKSDELIELSKAALRKREQLEREQVNE
jgi:hypothetical protein